jgi:DNA-3-methyladenine glycosylase
MELPADPDRLPREFYDRSAAFVARELLGKTLLRRLDGRWLGGWIVETEAYLSEGDLASHSARGKTAGNAAMFGPPGTLYVYPIHAKYCMNAVTEGEEAGSAVLIRAIEPVWGIEQMCQHRGTDQLRRLTRGPAMLCQALSVDRGLDAINLLDSRDIIIAPGRLDAFQITSTTRIGISTSTDLKLRFFVDGNWFVSGRASDHSSRPRRIVES